MEWIQNIDFTAFKNYTIDLLVAIFLTYGVIYLLRFMVHQFFKRTDFIEEKKEETIETVMANSSKYIALIIILLAAIKPFIDFKQLMVAGGVLGIVIGFGAQKSMTDFINCFFFLFEGQFRKGDFVQINESLEGGTVVDLGFRAVKIRLINGKVVTIANGEIRKVTNGNVDSRRVWESVIVSFRENPGKIKGLIQEVCDELNQNQQAFFTIDPKTGEFVEPYRVHGMSSLDVSPLGYKFNMVATVHDTDYVDAVQEAKEKLAQKMYDEKVLMPEQHVFYKTRNNG